ncbi:MAG: hypothetical protein ACJ75F_14975 [Flavisolibacter sp.]
MKKLVLLFFLFSILHTYGQNTTIKGFVDVNTIYQDKKLWFNLGEQDLFINSELNDRFTFLGETVFKFSLSSPTTFDISIERIVMKYNFSGNHNLVLGKHHTPINYWNDTYHHGRVFFPTIGRPLLFEDNFIPLHTTGLGIQGQNLGDSRFGYDVLIGNGIGSNDFTDNDKAKSVTLAAHIKPIDNLRFGASFYHDDISKGAKIHDGHLLEHEVKQQLYSASVAYFGKKFEFLSEGTFARNNSDSTGSQNSFGMYAYTGVKLHEKFIPYVRFDFMDYGEGEIFFNKNDALSIITGLRYVINYLAVLKLEYQYQDRQLTGSTNKVTAQVAIGF